MESFFNFDKQTGVKSMKSLQFNVDKKKSDANNLYEHLKQMKGIMGSIQETVTLSTRELGSIEKFFHEYHPQYQNQH